MQEIFDNKNYRPDMIKIYPCTVIKNTELYTWMEQGKYKPYSDKKLVEILKKLKSDLPYYVRISRLIRDIPSHHVLAGNKMTNLRQVIQAEMKKEGTKCNCLRCREVGHISIETNKQINNQTNRIKLFIDEYEASDGLEYFLSYEDKNRNVVFAFCRLRIKQTDKQINNQTTYPAFIRELHTYGQSLSIKQINTSTNKQKVNIQHKGLGKKLIEEAEKICKKHKVDKLAVISGVGVRGYYRKFGYKLEDGYMIKKF